MWNEATLAVREEIRGTAVCVCVVVAVLCLASQLLHAGPDRKATVVGETKGGAQNLAFPGYEHRDKEFDQNAGGSLTNHGYLLADLDSFKSYVNGEVVIWYIASGGDWVRKYGLFASDTWHRPIQIENCEIARFVYSASATVRASAEAALTQGGHETGDIFACASAGLTFKVDNAIVASDSRQAMAGTRNLEQKDRPIIVSGPYEYEGKKDGGQAKAKVANDGANPAKAEIDARVSHPKTTKNSLSIKFDIHSYGDTRVNVTETDYGWGRARVKHNAYPRPHTSGKYAGNGIDANQHWTVIVEAWDDDDPDTPVMIEEFAWKNWGDK